MRSHAPKVKRNETMTLSDRKHFAAMIRSGAKYREVLKEHLRIFKKTIRQVFKSIDNFEIEISREEQLMNIIERMDKFRCDDSDSDE